MYVGLYAICVWNWNWWLTQNHFLIKHWSQRTHRCSAVRCLPWEVIGAGQPLQHGEVRDTNLAWVRAVAPTTSEWSTCFCLVWLILEVWRQCVSIPICAIMSDVCCLSDKHFVCRGSYNRYGANHIVIVKRCSSTLTSWVTKLQTVWLLLNHAGQLNWADPG